MEIKVQNLSYQYGKEACLQDINLHVGSGKFIGVIGPNGSGKSTLLKTIYRSLKPDQGTIFLNEQDIQKMKYRQSSQMMSVVTQESETEFDFTVEEIVKMGRTPYKHMFDIDTKEDENLVEHALTRVGMWKYAKRNYQELSGGEKQRVLLARALCQDSELIILDEPTNHLDVYHQLQFFDLLESLPVTVLAAIHDLNIAAMYCDYLYVLKDGKLYTQGTPEAILNEKMIEEVFQVHAQITKHPLHHKLQITYIPESFRRSYEEK